MKKIGILTFHKAYNYGAVLQCYSLCKKLETEMEDAYIEVIDYASPKMMEYYSLNPIKNISYSLSSLEHKKCLAVSKIFIKGILDIITGGQKRKFERIRNLSISECQKFLPLSDCCDSLSCEEFIRKIEKRYDIIVVGSDAVWNDKQVDWPNPYYLNGLDGCKKYSYAASSYGMDYTLASEEKKKFVRSAWCNFEYIGVRDSATENYVNGILGYQATHHNCDPSIFLDLDKLPVSIEIVKNKLKQKGIDLNKPIIGFMCDDWLAKVVREHLGDQYQYVALYEWNRFSDFMLNELNPFEWAVVFRLFSATFTHFFHGTMFSLKNHTLTYAIEKKSPYSAKFKTKIVDALDCMQLTDRHYFIDEVTDDDWREISQEIVQGKSMEYEARIEAGLAAEVTYSTSFMEKLKNEIR